MAAPKRVVTKQAKMPPMPKKTTPMTMPPDKTAKYVPPKKRPATGGNRKRAS